MIFKSELRLDLMHHPSQSRLVPTGSGESPAHLAYLGLFDYVSEAKTAFKDLHEVLTLIQKPPLGLFLASSWLFESIKSSLQHLGRKSNVLRSHSNINYNR